MTFEANDMVGTASAGETKTVKIVLSEDGTLANRIYFRLIRDGDASSKMTQASSDYAAAETKGRYVFIPKSRAAVRKRLLQRFIARTAKFTQTDYGSLKKTL